MVGQVEMWYDKSWSGLVKKVDLTVSEAGPSGPSGPVPKFCRKRNREF